MGRESQKKKDVEARMRAHRRTEITNSVCSVVGASPLLSFRKTMTVYPREKEEGRNGGDTKADGRPRWKAVLVRGEQELRMRLGATARSGTYGIGCRAFFRSKRPFGVVATPSG